MIEDLFPCPTIVQGYELIEPIGKGSFGFVYKAKDLEKFDEYYAMKIIPKKNLTNKGDYDRLMREVNSMKKLNHPSIVALHNFFENDEFYFLVIDFCEGGSLFEYLQKSETSLREPQAATIFKQIVDAIAFIHHKGIAHRDLKPQNILVTTFPFIKISDFGLCGYIDGDNKMDTFCGSPCYSAPECINHQPYDGRIADVWSLGVILYELVTFKHPWNVLNMPQMIHQITNCIYEIPPTVTSACSDLIESMLKLNTAQRATIEEIESHPWMKLAQLKVTQRSMFPPLACNNITLDKASRRLSSNDISPFRFVRKHTSVGSDIHRTAAMPYSINPSIDGLQKFPLKKKIALLRITPKLPANVLVK